MKKYLFIIPVLILCYFMTLKSEHKDLINNSLSLDNDINEKEEKLVSVSFKNETREMLIDDYVVGVLSCEMPASFNIEALKAGAVVARTFYLYKANNDAFYIANQSDQCFIDKSEMREKWGESYEKYLSVIEEAVSSTSGEFLTYQNEIIQSFYFSMSNGYTESSENVFSESRPYLVSVDSSWDKEISSYEKSMLFSKRDFMNKLDLSFEDNLDIKIISRSNTGRVNNILVNGHEFKGTDFRKKLSLRSTDFDINVNGDDIKIVTRGYGHGVGLSQYGANEMAKRGYSYKEILKHYYNGVELSII